MPPLPIALCGKIPSVAAEFVQSMLPEYDVVHVCHSTETAISELPSLLGGGPTIETSGLGSNFTFTAESRKPKLIFAGAGFSRKEVKKMREIEVLKSIPWLVAVPKGSVPPPMEVIVARVKAALSEEGFAPGGELELEGGEGQVWEC